MLRTNHFPKATHRREWQELFRRLRLGGQGVWFLMPLLLSVVATCTPAFAQCSAPANPVVAENCLPGNPSSEWDISSSSNDGDPSLQGFATDISVNVGQTIGFKIKTDATSYTLNIYRMGYYGGLGARKNHNHNAFGNSASSNPARLPNRRDDALGGLQEIGPSQQPGQFRRMLLPEYILPI